MNVIRTIVLIIFFFLSLSPCALCADYRVRDIVVDNSDKLILIKGEGNFKNENSSIYVPIPDNADKSLNFINNITTFTITNPARYVVDINNAILPQGSRTYKIQNSKTLSAITLGQFSTNPNVVRIVFNTINPDDLINFKTYTTGSDIIIKYQNSIIENFLQYKFYTPQGDSSNTSNIQNTSATVTYSANNETMDLTPRFQTRYYLSKISQNSDGLILRGLGTISLERANYNADNTKATITMDSTTLSSKLDNKSFKIPSSQRNINATLTINKLNSRKVKLTLNGENLRDYRFVLSPDGQSLFISHRSYIINTIFSSNTAKVNSYKIYKTPANFSVFDVSFNQSVTYDVFELNDNFYLDINNLSDYDTEKLSAALKSEALNVQALKISTDKTRFIIPLKDLTFSYANVESNAKSIKICFKQKPVSTVQPAKESIVIAVSNNNEIKKEAEKEVKKEEKADNINVIYVPKNETSKIEKPKKKKNKEDAAISAMKKVVIDPGHGGADSGAIGGGIYEKTINLSISKLIEEKLKKKDIYVYMTRTKDATLTLEDRVNYSNEINPDIYVSIHTNSTVQEDSFGVETHYFKDDSYELASTIHSNFASEDNLKKWETKDRGVIKSRFYVINHTEAPSVLIEIGFISNLEERSKIIKKDRQEQIANSIVKGILEYLKVK